MKTWMEFMWQSHWPVTLVKVATAGDKFGLSFDTTTVEGSSPIFSFDRKMAEFIISELQKALKAKEGLN